jgi:hypothetical protein
LKQASCATVTDVVLQEKTKQKPAALNTVELLRAASKGKIYYNFYIIVSSI